MKGPLLYLAVLLALSPCLLEAYGPRSVSSSGNAVKWSLPVRIDLESDLDVREKDVTALVNEGLAAWSDLSDSNVTYNRKDLGVAVDADNVCCYLFDSAACPAGPTDDGTNPIVIDDDGEVVGKFFGSSNKLTTLGFAAVVAFNSTDGSAVKGEAVFNAACLAGAELDACTTAGLSFSENDFVSFIVHEIGHFLGLNHSQVNLTEAEDSDTSNDDKITTMYSFFIQGNGANFKTPERDDAVGLAFLYPESTFSSSTFKATGTVYASNGSTEFACANMIARNTESGKTRTDAISFVSGQMCPGETFDGSCNGDYQIQGLSPSASYTLEAEAIDSSFRNSSGIPPCEGSGQQPTFDAQTLSGSVSSSGGGTVSGKDFTLANTSTVVSLFLPSLDISPQIPFDPGLAMEAISALEAKSAADSCSSTDDDDDDSSDSSGCSLIRGKK